MFVAPYAAHMKKHTVAELSADPFLRDLESYGDHKLVSQSQAAGYLNKSITTLSNWRTSGKRPPGWIDDDGISYPVGELKRYVQEHLASTAEGKPRAAGRAPRAEGVLDADGRPRSAKDMDDYGLDEPLMRGGRRKKVNHDSFASFMASGGPADEWVFLMVPDPHQGATSRPVDLIASMELPHESLAQATCEQLSLTDYLDRLRFYLETAPMQDMADERQKESLALAPKQGRSKRHEHPT